MGLGECMTVMMKVSEIQVDERIREELGDIKGLAADIQNRGLLNPITICKGRLVAGFRRLTAMKLLGWEDIPVTIHDDWTEYDVKEAELIENVQRLDLAWPEKVKSIRLLLQLKQVEQGVAKYGKDGGFGMQDLAVLLGESLGKISQDLQLAELVAKVPSLGKIEKKSVALKKVKKLMDRVLREDRAKSLTTPTGMRFECADARQFLKTLESGSVNLVVTDPPWGVDVGTFRFEEDNTAWDAKDLALDVMDETFRLMDEVLAPNSHIYVFFGMKVYQPVYNMLVNRGWDVDWLPLIWDKGVGSSTMLVDQKYIPRYETIFFCRKGTARKLTKRSDDLIPISPVPGIKRVHPTQKPIQLLMQLIENSSVKGECVLDPFAGSSATLVAAHKLERRAVGCEMDESMYKKALTYIDEQLGVKEE